MRRTIFLALISVLVLFAWTSPDELDGGVSVGPDAADALDLFGSDDEPKTPGDSEREAFWRTDSGIEPAEPLGIPTSFADLAEHVAPAVVSIQTSGLVSSSRPGFPPRLEEFFGGSPWHNRRDRPKRRSSGEGSGFVISPDGYIVTNNHVIENTDEIKVRFLDGSELDAEVVGRDPKTDVALLKVDPKGRELKTIALGDSDEVRAGDWVVAIGNPFGLESTVTAGIVSAKHRRDVTDQSYEDFIQTDAAINPGNSGGPLIDLKGRVIGINTLIRSNANTIGFSVPINQAKQILPQLRADGLVTRGWLGVQIQAITPELAERFELDDAKGALVSQVLPDTPAAEGGIERGDVIIEFNGEEISEWRDLPIVVANALVDTKAKVVAIRDGKQKTFHVRVGQLDDSVQVASAEEPNATTDAFGLRAQDLTPEIANQLGLDNTDGAIITEVDPDGPAAEAGIRRGDVIVELDRKAIESAGDLAKMLKDAYGSVLVLVRRGDNTLYVPLKGRS